MKQITKQETSIDIRNINSIRVELGKKNLPIAKDKWYKDLIKYCKEKYPKNPEFAVKVIGAGITPYTANKLNKSKSYKSVLTSVVTRRTGGRYSLDDAIRSQDLMVFESNQFNEMNVLQEHLLTTGDLDVRQANRKVVETKLKGLRP